MVVAGPAAVIVMEVGQIENQGALRPRIGRQAVIVEMLISGLGAVKGEGKRYLDESR